MATRFRLVPKVMIIGNQRNTSEYLSMNLQEKLNLNVVLEPTPECAVQCWLDNAPDLLVLDVNLQEQMILNMVRDLREQTTTPILLLTNCFSDAFLLSAYSAGVDECIEKQISLSIFIAKVKAWLRRSEAVPVNQLSAIITGNIQLIPRESLLVLGKRRTVRLTQLELRLLYYLMSRPGLPVRFERLNQWVWDCGYAADNIALKNIIYRLRKKIEDDPAHPVILETLAGIGYRFAVQDLEKVLPSSD